MTFPAAPGQPISEKPQVTHNRFMETRTFGSLDGLRAISIIAVIWHHTASHAFSGSAIASRGYMGVNLFFVISGFLITTLLLREKQRHGNISIRNFIIRRVLRIFPLYYAVLMLYTLLVLVLEYNSDVGNAFLHNIRFYASYTSNWFVPFLDTRVIFYFAWSLAVEEQFYLVWPWIEEKMNLLGSSIAMGVLFALFAWLNIHVFACILMGVALAHLLHHPRTYAWLAPCLGSPGLSAGAAGLMILALAIPNTPEYAIFLALALFVATCVIREDHWLAPMLKLKPMVLIGQVSYGLYLVHMLVCNAVKRLGGTWITDQPWLLFVTTALIAIAAAWLSLRYFESFFLRQKERFAT